MSFINHLVEFEGQKAGMAGRQRVGLGIWESYRRDLKRLGKKYTDGSVISSAPGDWVGVQSPVRLYLIYDGKDHTWLQPHSPPTAQCLTSHFLL